MCGCLYRARRPVTNLRIISGFACLPWLLTGCQIGSAVSSATPATEVSALPGPIDTSALIEYGNAVRELSADGLEREYRAQLIQGGADKSSETRFRLILLLSNPEAPFYDLNRAVLLLEDFIPNQASKDSPDAEFAMLLYQLFSERRSIENTTASAMERLDDERLRATRLDEELLSTRTELDSQRAENEILRQQLEALVALEEQISLDEVDQSETEVR